jgi:ubiquinone/menaquinone biosynthesis C-methylase UbiE
MSGGITMSSDGKKEWQDTYYVCPVCKQPLAPTTNGLCCQRDGVEYPVKNGIPDFIAEDLTKSTSPFLRSISEFNTLANIYEGPSWYGTIDTILAELGLPSIEEGAKAMTEIVDAEGGVGLDVACGTGFFTRPLAQKMRLVYGIDVSMGMLEQATEYARERGIRNIRFAPSRVERLPFPDSLFDGVTNCGSLHLFQDTVEALKEMARVMKSGARLAVQTFVKGDLSIFKKYYERIPRELQEALHLFDEEGLGSLNAMEQMLHLFEVEELRSYLSQAGFRGFKYDVYEGRMLFHAEKE